MEGHAQPNSKPSACNCTALPCHLQKEEKQVPEEVGGVGPDSVDYQRLSQVCGCSGMGREEEAVPGVRGASV